MCPQALHPKQRVLFAPGPSWFCFSRASYALRDDDDDGPAARNSGASTSRPGVLRHHVRSAAAVLVAVVGAGATGAVLCPGKSGVVP